MYRYVKSNGETFHVTKNMLFTLGFVFKDAPDIIESTEEIKLKHNPYLLEFIRSYLDDICASVSNYLVETYPVTAGEPKPNSNLSSMYLPVALLDDSFPGKLRVELNYFARISRLSLHPQENEKKKKNNQDDDGNTENNNAENENIKKST